jgi:DNA replication protein DnaC
MREQTREKLVKMKLAGMLKALDDFDRSPDGARALGFEEKLAIMVDTETLERDNRATTRRVKNATFREQGQIEQIDWRHPRQLDREVFQSLTNCAWIKRSQNIVFVGPTGLGKTWLACALGQRACEIGYRVRFFRLPKLLGALEQSRADGSYGKLLAQISKADLLILDDWGERLNERERRDLREVIEDRDGRGSLAITTQLPIEHWHEMIGEPQIADAIVDRIVNGAHEIKLDGPSMRKERRRVDGGKSLQPELIIE